MSATDVGNLRIRLGVDPAEMNRGLSRARQHLRGFGVAAGRVGAAAAGAFALATAGLVALTRQGLAAVDSQAKLARTVDGTIDGLRALQIVASDAGSSADEIAGAAQRMGAKLAEAARLGAGPAHDALELMGLSAQSLLDMDVDQRFAEIADRTQELGLSAQQSADLLRQFGVRSAEVALVMTQGGDAIRAARQEVLDFGLSLSSETAGSVERANDAMARMGFIFEALRNQLAISMAPVLEQVAAKFREMSGAGGPLRLAVDSLVEGFSNLILVVADPRFIEAAATFGVTMSNALSAMARALIFATENAHLLAAAMAIVGAALIYFTGPTALAIAAVGAGVAVLSSALIDTATAANTAEEAQADLRAELERLGTASSGATTQGRALIETHISQARAAIAAAQAEYALARAEAAGDLDRARLLAESGRQTRRGQSVEYAQAELDALEGNFDRAIDEREAQLERYQRILGGFQMSQFPGRGVQDGQPSQIAAPVADDLETAQLSDDLAELIALLDPAAAGTARLAAAQELLRQSLDAQLITQDEFNARMAELNGHFAETPVSAGVAASAIDDLGDALVATLSPAEEFADGMSGAFDKLTQTLGGSKDALKNFATEAIRLLAVRGISSILGGSDWFNGPLFSAPGNALGTDHWRGGMSWVGERGPELVNLPRGAQVVPNHRIGGGGGGASFTYAPMIDAKGASLAAVQELRGQMRADADSFNGRVQAAVRSAQRQRML
jgi:hypothetical protein